MREFDLACNLNAIPSAERKPHEDRWQTLLKSKMYDSALSNGYEWVFSASSETLVLIADVTKNKRLCCPFLSFQIMLEAGEETIKFQVTGPEGAKELLRAELGL